MQQPIVIFITASILLSPLNALAQDKIVAPIQIHYVQENKSFFGDKYNLYRVYCSDGKKYPISYWKNKSKPWCLGKKRKTCDSNQLPLAVLACLH